MNASTSIDDFRRYQRVSSALGVADFSRKLIHYTSMNSFEAMLASNELWFGRLCELTDTDEGNHFLDAVLEQVPRLIVGSDNPGLAALIPIIRQAIRSGTYVSSWCEYFDLKADGRLEMWREYGDRGAGVGIVVDSSQFLPSAITRDTLGFHVMTAKVEYVPARRAVDLANNYLARLANVEFLRAPLEDKIVLANMLAIKAPCVKHDGFEHEEEIRFIYMPEMLRLMQRPVGPGQLRTLASGRSYYGMPLVEYAEHNLDLRITTMLKHVVVGPGNDQVQRAKKVRELLNQRGLGNVDVHLCGIPFAAAR